MNVVAQPRYATALALGEEHVDRASGLDARLALVDERGFVLQPFRQAGLRRLAHGLDGDQTRVAIGIELARLLRGSLENLRLSRSPDRRSSSPVRRGPLPSREQRARVSDGAALQIAFDRLRRGTPARSPAVRSIGLADRMKSSARSAPISRGRRCVPPAPGMMPSVTSGKREARGRRGDAVVTGQRDLESAAHHRAVHGGDHRKFERFEAVEQRAVFDFARRTAELADIRAGEECVAFAHQHDRADVTCATGSARELRGARRALRP